MDTLDVVVLPAFHFADDSIDELQPWLDRHEFDAEVPLAPAGDDFHSPLYHDASLGVMATGIGPSAAATSATALLHSDFVDTDHTLFVSAGVAGGPPSRTTLGATFVTDVVVDWDAKHRVAAADLADDERTIDLHGYRPRDYVYRPEDTLVERALDVASDVELLDWDLGAEVRERYPEADSPTEPFVDRGTTVAGAEFWHGEGVAAEVEWLVDAYDAGTYVTTESEDAGTAHALYRHDAMDRYVSLRSVSNFDRPPAGESPRESLNEWDDGMPLAVENVYRVASAVAADVREHPDAWQSEN